MSLFYNIEWTSVGITVCNYVTSKPVKKELLIYMLRS